MIDVPPIEAISDGLYRVPICTGASRRIRLTVLLPMSILAWCMPLAVGVSIIAARKPNADDFWGLFLFVAAVACWNAAFACFFYLSSHAEVDVESRSLRTIIFLCGRRVRTRRFHMHDGDELGISSLGMRSSFQHTIYCYHGRRRWRFLCFDTNSADPDRQLLKFAATIARHTNATFLGYSEPNRLLVA